MGQGRWTWREALGVVVLGVFLLGLLMPAMGRTVDWTSDHRMQLRYIHMGLILYSQGNRDYYPGLGPDGRARGLDVEARYRSLFEADLLPGRGVISPHEPQARSEWTGGAVTVANYSYAMLQVPDAGGRREEWRETMNGDAIVISDRNLGTATAPRGPLTGQPRPTQRNAFGCTTGGGNYGSGWAGAVAFNDHRVEMVETHVHDTVYGGVATVDDHIFEAAGDDDAYMVHEGN